MSRHDVSVEPLIDAQEITKKSPRYTGLVEKIGYGLYDFSKGFVQATFNLHAYPTANRDHRLGSHFEPESSFARKAGITAALAAEIDLYYLSIVVNPLVVAFPILTNSVSLTLEMYRNRTANIAKSQEKLQKLA
jgi:hypothetical protein